MKKDRLQMKLYHLLMVVFIGFCTFQTVQATEDPLAKDREYYELRIYQMGNKDQVALVERFLQGALLPALHRSGINKVGVFKTIGNDTAAIKRVYVLIPYKSLEQHEKTAQKLDKDKDFERAGAEYINVVHNKPAYLRMESIFLRAFEYMPKLAAPQLKGPRSERVYELRSYEGASEKIFRNKVHMFNQGGEVTLFRRLGFNAVFYGEVVAGGRMPNLMYMTTFENKAARDEHWKTFGNDPEWKTLSAKPEYQNNVSKIDIFFLTPTEYSDL